MASRKPKKVKSAAESTSVPAAEQGQSLAAPAVRAAKKASSKTAARRTATPKRRGPGRPKGSKNKAPTAAKPAAKKSARPRRYTPAERANILAAAKREGLSGPAAAKKFGISQLAFYTWRRKSGTKHSRPVGRPSRKGTPGGDVLGGGMADRIRQEIRARVSELLPSIIASEIVIALEDAGSGRGRRRR